jgi:hypothetical protein
MRRTFQFQARREGGVVRGGVQVKAWKVGFDAVTATGSPQERAARDKGQ